MKRGGILLFLLVGLAAVGDDTSVVEACRNVRSQIADERTLVADHRSAIAGERTALRKKGVAFRAEIARVEAELVKVKALLAVPTARDRGSYSLDRAESRVWDSIRDNLKEFEQIHALAFPGDKRVEELRAKSAESRRAKRGPAEILTEHERSAAVEIDALER